MIQTPKVIPSALSEPINVLSANINLVDRILLEGLNSLNDL
jgi:hypothetical protein